MAARPNRRLQLERGHVHDGGGGRAYRSAQVGKGERLRLERGYVHDGGGGRAPRSAQVGKGERLRLERGRGRTAATTGRYI